MNKQQRQQAVERYNETVRARRKATLWKDPVIGVTEFNRQVRMARNAIDDAMPWLDSAVIKDSVKDLEAAITHLQAALHIARHSR